MLKPNKQLYQNISKSHKIIEMQQADSAQQLLMNMFIYKDEKTTKSFKCCDNSYHSIVVLHNVLHTGASNIDTNTLVLARH